MTTDHLRQLVNDAQRVQFYSDHPCADAAVRLIEVAPALLDVVEAARKMSVLLDQTVGVDAGNQKIKVSSKSEEVMAMFCTAQNAAREALARLAKLDEVKP